MVTELVLGDKLVEFEVGSISVTEEELPDGFRIHEEGNTLGVDIEKHGEKLRYTTHSWDGIKLKLAKDIVESEIFSAELRHNFAGIGKRLAEELGEIDSAT